MSKILDGYLYTKDDEWLKVEGEFGTIGISDHAQDALSDIVYLELPNVGDFFGIGETFGVVESVKAAADLMMPASGDIVEVNESLVDTPEKLNSDPYGSWLIKIKLSHPSELKEMMDAAAYTTYCAERE
ncbi:MAG: glycine cleavage system protein GcvH [Anaerolinea sp.]|nr:glycine cleavage system protein GcvH [Anaerolinea sp.]